MRRPQITGCAARPWPIFFFCIFVLGGAVVSHTLLPQGSEACFGLQLLPRCGFLSAVLVRSLWSCGVVIAACVTSGGFQPGFSQSFLFLLHLSKVLLSVQRRQLDVLRPGAKWQRWWLSPNVFSGCVMCCFSYAIIFMTLPRSEQEAWILLLGQFFRHRLPRISCWRRCFYFKPHLLLHLLWITTSVFPGCFFFSIQIMQCVSD